MKKLLIIIAILVAAAPGMAQNYYFPAVKGAQLTYKHYDERGRQMKDKDRKPVWTTFTVEDVWPGENGGMVINVLIENQQTAGINRKVYEGAYVDNMIFGDVKIEGDSVVLDNMQGLLLRALGNIPRKNANYESVEIKMNAVMVFPRELHVGLELPDRTVLDASVKMNQTSEAAERDREMLMAIYAEAGIFRDPGNKASVYSYASATIKNWRVEGEEKVETPAGVFECYKITYILEAYYSSIMEIAYAEWISPQVGLVKKVEYARKDKVAETMVLESYTE